MQAKNQRGLAEIMMEENLLGVTKGGGKVGGGVERGVKIKKSAGAAALSDRSVFLILIIVRSSPTRS